LLITLFSVLVGSSFLSVTSCFESVVSSFLFVVSCFESVTSSFLFVVLFLFVVFCEVDEFNEESKFIA